MRLSKKFTKIKLSKKKSTFLLILPIMVLTLLAMVVKKIVYLSAKPIADCRDLLHASTQNNLSYLIIEKLQRHISFAQTGGTIDDVSCLNETEIHGVIKVQTEEDVREALLYAGEKNLKVSIAGVRHSMGGQAFFKDSVVLDMTSFNAIVLDESNKTMTVQSGATWHDIQKYIDPKGLSVKAMQSSDIFTVGGSISVNAHGMDHKVGSLSETLVSLRLMLEDGTVRTISRTQYPELFRSVVGGYGLFGVILDAKIELTDNVMVNKRTRVIDYTEFPDVYNQISSRGDDYELFYAHLSTGPNSFLKEVILNEYFKVSDFQDALPVLHEKENVDLKRFFLNLGKTGRAGMQVRYWGEKYLQPMMESCLTTRNQVLGEPEACFISRNQEMHESAGFLRNNLKNDTDILQEYYIPRDKFVTYVDGMREILQSNDAVVLNAGIRLVNKEDIALNYAPEDSYAMVLYLNQKLTTEAEQKMRKITEEMVDLTLSVGGKPYLPYQLLFTKEQLIEAYPNIDTFFESKKKYDPDLIFMNSLYEKYATY